MGFLELLDERKIKVPLESTTKDAAIKELIELLDSENCISDRELAYQDVLKREALGSTGLEDGIAIPHAKTAAVKEMCLAIGINSNGIDFNSYDGKPSKLFFLILAPPDMSGPHVEVLLDIAKCIQSVAIRRMLIASKNSAEVISIFEE